MSILIPENSYASKRLKYLLKYINSCYKKSLSFDTRILNEEESLTYYKDGDWDFSTLYNGTRIIRQNKLYACGSYIIELRNGVISFNSRSIRRNHVNVQDLEDPDYCFNISTLYPDISLVLLGAVLEFHKQYRTDFIFNEIVFSNYLGYK